MKSTAPSERELLAPDTSLLTVLYNLRDQLFFPRPALAERRNAHDLLRMVVQQLEPFLGRIVGRQHLAFAKLRMDRGHDIINGETIGSRSACGFRSHDAPAARRLNRPLDRPLLGALDDGSQDRPA